VTVREAFKYTDPRHREELRHQVHLGVGSFVRDHQEFFAHVVES
jgi:mannitol-1-phosphate/altronate dehydrogenase